LTEKDVEEAHFGQIRVAAFVRDIPHASRMLELAETIRARQTGLSEGDVRSSFANKLAVSAKTLRLIREKKRKTVPHFLMAGIRTVMIEVLKAEIRSLEHEIRVAEHLGVDHREDAFAEAAAALDVARKLLERAVEKR
jgi:hypothetical protein